MPCSRNKKSAEQSGDMEREHVPCVQAPNMPTLNALFLFQDFCFCVGMARNPGYHGSLIIGASLLLLAPTR